MKWDRERSLKKDSLVMNYPNNANTLNPWKR